MKPTTILFAVLLPSTAVTSAQNKLQRKAEKISVDGSKSTVVHGQAFN
ncbi:MAG TPA: hypothetical protein VFD24_08545 [Chitinophagaceae bacterium]|jgi:hypothetical protein|nr:hypothetical protein [Chitinophagaceae bacterium]